MEVRVYNLYDVFGLIGPFYGNGDVPQKSGGLSDYISRDMSRTVAEKNAG